MAAQHDGRRGETFDYVPAFDYVIVGAGAAGSVLANRLTEDAGVTVCVLECGPPDRHPYIHVPAGFIKMLFNPTYTWQFTTEPGEGTAGRRIPTTQGRTLGGSSSINGMVYNRGQKADFDHWHSAAIAAGATPTCCRISSARSGGSASPTTASMGARATCR